MIFWILIIPGAIFAYITIGFLVILALCKLCNGDDWRNEMQDDAILPMIFFWPLVFILAIVVIPVEFVKYVLEKICENE